MNPSTTSFITGSGLLTETSRCLCPRWGRTGEEVGVRSSTPQFGNVRCVGLHAESLESESVWMRAVCAGIFCRSDTMLKGKCDGMRGGQRTTACNIL